MEEWRNSLCFGDFDLSHVLLFNDPSIGLEGMLPGLSIREEEQGIVGGGTKRGRGEEKGDAQEDGVGDVSEGVARSNRRMPVLPNEPVRLPHFGQNLLLGSDKSRVEEARQAESTLRSSLTSLKARLVKGDAGLAFFFFFFLVPFLVSLPLSPFFFLFSLLSLFFFPFFFFFLSCPFFFPLKGLQRS